MSNESQGVFQFQSEAHPKWLIDVPGQNFAPKVDLECAGEISRKS
jgi:hypothetical protein